MPDQSALLKRLLDATRSSEILTILTELGDHPERGIRSPFGTSQFFWEPYDGNAFNMGSIGFGSKSGRSLTERITNAIDALIDARASNAPMPKPNSPQDAMSTWFGRPITGPDKGLYQWDYTSDGYDRRIHVILQPSDMHDTPTVDILDSGVGIAPADFPKTILSLQRGNKITKKYLAGAYGQGGASTLRFCDYVLIVSRSESNSAKVGFTLVRNVRLGEDYKEDCYAFLAWSDASGTTSVLESEDSTPLLIKTSESLKRTYSLTTGTLVRHFGFQLANTAGKLAPQPGNLYHFLHYSMFDPLFPFRIVDNRDSTSGREELVRGSRNRLMDYAKDPEADDESSRTQLKHYRSMEWVTPAGSAIPCVGVEYWVIFNYEKKKETYHLRPDSNALFVQKRHPIVFTYNGQNQGDIGNYIFKQANRPMVARHAIVHVDASRVGKDVRKGLFTSTREGLIEDGPVVKSILQEISRMISEDEVLDRLEKQLEEAVTQRTSQETEDEVQKQISALLKEAGYESTEKAETVTPGENENGIRPRTPRPPKPPQDPLPTLPYPEVSFVKIVYPEDAFELELNSTVSVLIHTDADARMHEQLRVRFEPDVLEVASVKPLSGGRARWRLKAKQGSTAGQSGNVVVTMTRLDGSQLSDSIDFTLTPPKAQPAQQGKGKIPPFEVLPVNPDDAEWDTLWDEEDFKDKHAVAYKALKTQGKIIVYYSTVFTPLAQTLARLKVLSESKMKLFTTNYKVWIGYHAIIQLKGQQNEDAATSDEGAIELERDHERVRVAQLQLKQAMAMTELMLKASKAQEAER